LQIYRFFCKFVANGEKYSNRFKNQGNPKGRNPNKTLRTGRGESVRLNSLEQKRTKELRNVEEIAG
jgi:hypothetical protein